MHLSLTQHMRMSQQMKLAPRMIQSMEILQLPIMALNERIEQELAENFVLESGTAEEEQAEADAEPQAELAPEEPRVKDLEQRELVVDNEHNNEADFERLLEMSANWPDDNMGEGARPSSNRIEEESDRRHDAVSNMEARPQSLQDYLLEQFRFFNCEKQFREFGEYLIQNLDGNGRLQSSLAEVAQVYDRTISLEDAHKVLALVQKLDPPGVGARDVKECLLLQITPETPYRDVLVTLLSSHLEDVEQNRLPVIQRKTGYDLETINDAIEEMRHLNPWPGQGFEDRPAQNITPDLIVEQDENGKYVVRLVEENTPRLRII